MGSGIPADLVVAILGSDISGRPFSGVRPVAVVEVRRRPTCRSFGDQELACAVGLRIVFAVSVERCLVDDQCCPVRTRDSDDCAWQKCSTSGQVPSTIHFRSIEQLRLHVRSDQ